jgi:hypothetical protein
MKISAFKKLVSECIDEIKTESLVEMKVIPIEDFVKNNLNEADFLGASTRDVSDDEMQNYMAKTATGEKTAKDRFDMPYVHASNIEIKNQDGRKYDLEALKRAVMTRPKKLLKQNEKLAASGGVDGFVQFYNIGLPALKGLAVDEKTGKFVVVDTCPGAGACKVYCYARKGGYIQFPDASLSQTKVLNFLLNDPAGFSKMLENEIAGLSTDLKGKEIKNVIRWHDAGDFFSPDYLALAFSVARKFPKVNFYAYTKMASVSTGEKPDNFLINFSMGAKKEEERRIDFTKSKNSTVVQKSDFTDLLQTEPGANGRVKYVKDEKGRVKFKSEKDLDTLKDRMAKRFNVQKDSILTYDEMRATPESDEIGKYNVIVRPKDGDDSASRKDVLGTYLLIH